MNIFEILYTSFRSLKANKLRTFLTMLGITIGVFSVVLLVSLVRGVQNYVTDQFNSIGSNLVFITPGRFALNKDPATIFTDNKLSTKQVDILLNQESSYIQYATPVSATALTLKYKNQHYFSTIMGVYPSYINIFNVALASGRFLDQSDNNGSKKVIVLGATVGKNLFGDKNPIGQSIKVGTTNFEVIGVLSSKTQEVDEGTIIPYMTSKNILDVANITEILAKLKTGENIEIDMKRIESAFLRDLKRDDFSVLNQNDLLQSIQSILQILSFGLSAVAAISLIVGGIGIMNIMLVAVSERIREIGLRKAVGATSFMIGFQFFIESVFLSLTGGLIGLLLGFLASLVARRFVRTEVPLWAFVVSIGFSLIVGMVFGTYPAYKASKKNPIEALRYE